VSATRGLAHLIGSVPLATTDEVFRKLAGTLGDLLVRMPDGETGERGRWVWWQRTMIENHPAMEVDREAGPLELKEWNGAVLRSTDVFSFKPGVDPDRVEFRTGYAEAALASWTTFKALQRAGVLPDDVKFQVCLPTPNSSAYMYVGPRSHDAYLRVYERSLMRALRDITLGIPHESLSIQWDICQEVLVFENYFPTRPADYKTRIVALLERLGDAVPDEVELGYHLCYGSPADTHLVMLKDARILAELADAIVSGVGRKVDFLHVPVPRARDDREYFAPFAALRLQDWVQLYLGLLHYDDADGDRRRIDAARRVVDVPFGVATDCGWGRTDPARVDGLLDSHRRAAAYLPTVA
jgi:hypothetical protein